jgi:Uma2 family endonuclease
MRVAEKPELPAEPVRFDFNDFVRYTEQHPEGNFELLDGVIYELAPEGDAHLITRLTINTYLHQVVNLTKYTIGTEGSFPAPGWKEGPKPDNFVSRGALAQTLRRPTAEDVLLVIEITTSPNPSDDDELKRKLATYARVGIPDYWLVDLVGGRVLVNRGPGGNADPPHYASVSSCGRHEAIAALAVDDLSIGTDLLLQMSGIQ